MTAKSAIPAVAVAVYAALNGAAITTTLGCPVYDNVPQAAPFPLVTPHGEPADGARQYKDAYKQVEAEGHLISPFLGGE